MRILDALVTISRLLSSTSDTYKSATHLNAIVVLYNRRRPKVLQLIPLQLMWTASIIISYFRDELLLRISPYATKYQYL